MEYVMTGLSEGQQDGNRVRGEGNAVNTAHSMRDAPAIVVMNAFPFKFGQQRQRLIQSLTQIAM